DDTVGGGNLFNGQDNENDEGAAIHVMGCVTHVTVSYNTFTSLDTGILIQQTLGAQSTQNEFSVTHNRFEHLLNAGITISGGATVIRSLSDNSFSDVSTASRPSYGFPASALVLEGQDEPGFPLVAKARNNSFIANDIGIFFRSYGQYKASF